MREDTGADDVGVKLNGISKRFDGIAAVDNVSLDIEGGSFFSLLGPSGCGKSTLLRIIAGLERADSGTVEIAGEDVSRDDPRSRPTAMVFQNYALFPHMTVGENVGYGLRVRRVGKTERARRVADALRRVDLAGLESRSVVLLSGGQQQRVALARALAVEPRVLLFDEPLSNLDVALREQTRRELKLLQTELHITSIYVTHDQQEALALSNRVAVMRSGKLVQVDRPEVLFDRPTSAFVARFLGLNVVNQARATQKLATIPGDEKNTSLAIRPDKLFPCSPDEPGAVPVTVVSRQFLGTHNEWLVDSEAGRLRLWLDPDIALEETLHIRSRQSTWVAS